MIPFLSVIEDAPLLTKTVKINQSEGIPGSGIPERTFVKNSYKRSRTSLPSPPLLFIAFFTSHRSPSSERLEKATIREKYAYSYFDVLCYETVSGCMLRQVTKRETSLYVYLLSYYYYLFLFYLFIFSTEIAAFVS